MTDLDLVDRLAQHKTLGAAPREELARLAARGSLRQMNAGDVLFCQYCGTRLVEQRLPDVVSVGVVQQPASNRSTDRLVEQAAHAAANIQAPALALPAAPIAAAVRVVASQQVGFRLVVVHRDGTSCGFPPPSREYSPGPPAAEIGLPLERPGALRSLTLRRSTQP